MTRKLHILGIRGIPARHGGFETFAEHLALHLTKKGWDVTVYCQDDGKGDIHEDRWNGVRLVRIPVSQQGSLGTMVFDWKSTLHACREADLVLTLGYNTAIFCIWYRLRGIKNIINMDGIEWRRKKWSRPARIWLRINEYAGALLGNHLVADHPEISKHLATKASVAKISTIAYGAPAITSADRALLDPFRLSPHSYAVIIARPEPENSVLEIVRAWSRKPRGLKLVVLGRYAESDHFQGSVLAAASSEVVFPGAIYDPATVAAIRFFSKFYIHGHQVGGTNPSLVEAMGAGNAVLAHNNRFNRWVAGRGAEYFDGEDECDTKIDTFMANDFKLAYMRKSSAVRHKEEFTWPKVLDEYEALFYAVTGTQALSPGMESSHSVSKPKSSAGGK